MSNDLATMTVAELRAELDSRRVSAVEILDATIREIERLEPTLNAFASTSFDLAHRQAEAADRRIAGGERAPLLGIPTSIKDLFDVAGQPTESGSHTQAGRIAVENAPMVERLTHSGAVLLGKTTTSEFGWTGVSRSPRTGVTHNPWRRGLNAGASSAGAGVAAAAGYGPVHQGSDGAGSIRMPAHFCGVFGFKPTYGRIPNWPVRNNDQTSHVGPLSRSVHDAALFLEVTAGTHPWDHTSFGAPAEPFGSGLDEIDAPKIAFSTNLGHARVDAEVADAVAAAAGLFASGGFDVESVEPPFGPAGPELARFFWSVHEAPLERFLPEFEDRMDPGLVACIRAEVRSSAVTYLTMRQRKLDYVEAMHRFMVDWDLLLTPAVSVPAFPAVDLQPADWPQHDWDWMSWAEFSYPFNMSGQPAASIPCGFTRDGLPIGLQIVGRRGEDHRVLKAAAWFERAQPWLGEVPALCR